MGQADQAVDHGERRRSRFELSGEREIELQDVERQHREVAQAGIAGAEVINSETKAIVGELTDSACGFGDLSQWHRFSELEAQICGLQSVLVQRRKCSRCQ